MESVKNNNQPAPSFKLLFGLSAAVCIISIVIFFILGWLHHSRAEQAIDKASLHMADQLLWLVCLFGLPYLAQVVGLIFLFFNFNKDSNRDRITFYIFCLFPALFSLSYSILWAYYTNSSHSQFLSYLALGFVGVLLLPVILLTYAIMWTPDDDRPKGPSLLKKNDIADWAELRSKLYEENKKHYTPGKRILECVQPAFCRDFILKGERQELDQVSKDDLLAALNEVLKDPDFYEPDYFKNITNNSLRKDLERCKRDLTSAEVQWVNRRLLQECYNHEINKNKLVVFIPRRTIRWWENWLKNLKNGMAKSPFWALVFFFSAFLSITYLLGFALAFHDKKTVQERNAPALYLAKSYPSTVGAQQLSGEDNKNNNSQEIDPSVAISWPNYKFYFESNSAHPIYRKNFDEEGYQKLLSKSLEPRESKTKRESKEISAQLEEKNREWGENKNYEHLKQMIRAIQRSTNDGEGILIDLKGSADDSPPKDTSYSSNYALSEARAQNIKSQLLDGLAAEDHKRRSIEWSFVPLSSEILATPPSLEEELPLDGKRETVDELIKNADLYTEDRKDLEMSNYRIKELIKRNPLPPDSEESLLEKLQHLITSLAIKKMLLDKELKDQSRVLSSEEKQTLQEKTEQAKAELKESIDFVQHIEKNAGRRVAVASIKLTKTDNHFIPLSLLDYMYFTIYTTTTTGYGDIVPITTYAKFLCSLANILEVFFLVVFFNALLSVKGDGKSGQHLESK
ncbi:MAG TPA: ion channel [Blastocatellia bacterium]|jgi:flagellar motor protein MotB|nr:ion channel [Blastocatellia bacterium]